MLTEYVRQALRRQITWQFTADCGKISVLTLDRPWKNKLRDSVQQSDYGSYLALGSPVSTARDDNLCIIIEDLTRKDKPIVLAPPLRLYFKRLLIALYQLVYFLIMNRFQMQM